MAETLDTKPMDRRELQNCARCGHGMMHEGAIHFYELTVAQCIVDLNSVRQQHGLEVMMGVAAPLAAVLAPSTTVAQRLPAKRVLLCATCAMHPQMPMAFLEDNDGGPDEVPAL